MMTSSKSFFTTKEKRKGKREKERKKERGAATSMAVTCPLRVHVQPESKQMGLFTLR